MPPQPPAWQYTELRRLGERAGAFNDAVIYRDWAHYLLAMLREYPHLSGADLNANVWGHPMQGLAPSGPRQPVPSELQWLHTAYQTAQDSPGDPRWVDCYAHILSTLMHEYPHLTVSEIDRLRAVQANTVFQNIQPPTQRLMELEAAWQAAQTGDRGHANGYILAVAETLRQYPNLSATELNRLHRERRNGFS